MTTKEGQEVQETAQGHLEMTTEEGEEVQETGQDPNHHIGKGIGSTDQDLLRNQGMGEKGRFQGNILPIVTAAAEQGLHMIAEETITKLILQYRRKHIYYLARFCCCNGSLSIAHDSSG